MNLFEYQGKDLYKKYSIATPKSIFINSISDLTENHGLSFPLVVKAQVQVGGRGKAGGIKVAKKPSRTRRAYRCNSRYGH